MSSDYVFTKRPTGYAMSLAVYGVTKYDIMHAFLYSRFITLKH